MFNLNYCIMTRTEKIRILKNSECLRMFKDSEYGHYKLKWMSNFNLEYLISEDYIEKVSLSDYVKIEKNKIPLFIESQYGSTPSINHLLIDGEERVIAIIHKAKYSSFAFSLTLYNYVHEKRHKIIEFSNDKIIKKNGINWMRKMIDFGQ